jgi:hypothetical protein
MHDLITEKGGRVRSLIAALILLFSIGSLAKELSSRLGVGFRNAYAIDIPSIATVYYPSTNWGMVGALGLDTRDQNSSFAFSGGIRKIIFMEDNMNFFMGGQLSFLSQQVLTVSNSGFELAALAGGEFFLQGLDNLGFNFETGIGVTNLGSVRFRTLGDSFLRAGMFFYF